MLLLTVQSDGVGKGEITMARQPSFKSQCQDASVIVYQHGPQSIVARGLVICAPAWSVRRGVFRGFHLQAEVAGSPQILLPQNEDGQKCREAHQEAVDHESNGGAHAGSMACEM